MTIEDIAPEINRQRLYRKRDGFQADSWGVGARAVNDIIKGTPLRRAYQVKKVDSVEV